MSNRIVNNVVYLPGPRSPAKIAGGSAAFISNRDCRGPIGSNGVSSSGSAFG